MKHRKVLLLLVVIAILLTSIVASAKVGTVTIGDGFWTDSSWEDNLYTSGGSNINGVYMNVWDAPPATSRYYFGIDTPNVDFSSNDMREVHIYMDCSNPQNNSGTDSEDLHFHLWIMDGFLASASAENGDGTDSGGYFDFEAVSRVLPGVPDVPLEAFEIEIRPSDNSGPDNSACETAPSNNLWVYEESGAFSSGGFLGSSPTAVELQNLGARAGGETHLLGGGFLVVALTLGAAAVVVRKRRC